MTFEVFDSGQVHKWRECLGQIPTRCRDVFYRPEYLISFAHYEQAEALCFCMRNNDYLILYPVLKKEIVNFDVGDRYFDISSAYGYGGAIANFDTVPEELRQSFNKAVDDWCRSNNVIAEFIRENPVLRTQEHYLRDARYFRVRYNVYVDPEDEPQLKSANVRRNLRKAARTGLYAEVDESLQSLQRFIDLYAMTARRLQMAAYYRFDEEYFQRVQATLGDAACLINVCKDNVIIASTLFFHTADYTTYFLGASDFAYSDLRPNDLLFTTMIESTGARGARLLCLGGGTSDDENDSLFRFKRKFASEIREVYAGARTLNEAVYTEIVRQWSARNPELAKQYPSFFLKYRLEAEGAA